MKQWKRKVIVGMLFALGAIGSAAADVIVDHQPLNTGGPAADTLFVDMFGSQIYQLAADDMTLQSPATVQHIRWWGFYGSSSGGDSNMPPTENETMRVRLYGARPSDGLPDSASVLLEQSLLNPSRVWTGRIITGGTGAHEYVYDADLATPFTLMASTEYWLEIVQVGDVSSHFRREISVNAEHNDLAIKNPTFVPNWGYDGLAADIAFQLSTVPEPSAAMLILASCGVRAWRKLAAGGGK